jgi:hypothetical protein
MFRTLLLMALLSFGIAVRAQPILPPPTGEVIRDSATEEVPPPTDDQPQPPGTELMGGPDWDQLPQRASRWNIDFAYVPTTIFGDNKHMGEAFRLNVAHEDPDGYGRRARLWLFEQDHFFYRDDDLYATTFAYDFYRRLPIERGDVKVGLSPMLGILDTTTWRHRYDQQFYGLGLDAFAEGFYPLWRFERTDIGPVGYGRLGFLAGVWDQRGSLRVGRDSIAIVDEFAWGLELRHRFGPHQNKYYYINVMREIQDWGSPGLPYVAGLDFQGTAINFGLEW